MAADVIAASRFRALWDSRRILQLLVGRDLKVKYANLALGYVWTVLEPLLLAVLYWFVFTQIFTRSVGEEPYIVFLLCGLLPWQWANGALNRSSGALSAASKLVRSTRLPREIWVLRTVASRFAEFVLSLPVIVIFAALTGATPSLHLLLVPLAVLLQLIFLVGCSLILAPVTVMYADVERLVRLLLRMLFYASAVLYGLHDVKDRLGDTFYFIFILNPLAGIFDLYRAAFFPEQWAGWGVVGITAAVSVTVLVLGLWVFRRLEGRVLKEI
ncbi:MAG: ABC transporter permease [Actinomycetes bacterium]